MLKKSHAMAIILKGFTSHTFHYGCNQYFLTQ